MESETVNKLLALNHTFYSRFSGEFADSRSSERFNIEPLRAYLKDGMRLLDAGCGNGRLATTLQAAGYTLDYVGVDGSAELIGFAGERQAGLTQVRALFRVVDLGAAQWRAALADVAPFDVVVSLAVLHHIPSFERRAQVFAEIRTLLRPGGILVVSNWQFTHSERLTKKIVGWETIGLTKGQVEPEDYLLDWKRGGTGYRYVHLIEPQEVEQLAEAAGFRVVKQFYADENLNLYSVMEERE